MADADWKKRTGLNINYNSSGDDDEDFRVEYRVKNNTATNMNENSRRIPPATDEIFAKYDDYGSTPPRTRIKNKNRDWDRRQKLDATLKQKSVGSSVATGISTGGDIIGLPSGQSRMVRSRANRRNTMDCAILNDLFVEDDSKQHPDKRTKQMMRDSERESKRASLIAPIQSHMSITDAVNPIVAQHLEERAESMPLTIRNTVNAAPLLIECNNLYMSITSRQIGCRTSAPPSAFQTIINNNSNNNNQEQTTCRYDRSKLQIRREFHETFANLIKLGSSAEKQESKISHEDFTWQTELKDLIWLELQAWHADRSLEQQDKYLYTARLGVPDLLDRILNYKFRPAYEREISNDSGISLGSENRETKDGNTTYPPYYYNRVESLIPIQYNKGIDECKDCLSLYCLNCQKQQSIALREVEELLTRLEAAEALYPSSQVMGTLHPTYKCESFVGRVKAMCLWYNITKYQRLKLTLVGNLFRKLQGKSFKWPINEFSYQTDSAGSSSSGIEIDDSGQDTMDSINKFKPPKSMPKVKFSISGDQHHNANVSASPPESVSSNESMKEVSRDEVCCSTSSFAEFIHNVQQMNLDPATRPKTYSNGVGDVGGDNSSGGFDDCGTTRPPVTSPYRKYIEHIMKSRGLGKSLSFLHRMHNVITRKVQVTLEKPGTEDVEFDADIFDQEVNIIHTPIDKEQEEELRRYGIWSPEGQSLNLPSYAPAFVFLSVIPLEIMHEYLRMRIESKPHTPNPLSLEQLMKEVREGLILAMTHRERFNKHIHTALLDKPNCLDKYMVILGEFDETVNQVLALYLDYVQQWVLEATPEGKQKAAINKEWVFTKLMCPMISGQHAIAAKRFCFIVSTLLRRIGERLTVRATELDQRIDKTPSSNFDTDKWQIFTICREIQSLFSIERENSLKILNFAKIFCKDLEAPDFHRDHENDTKNTIVCDEVKSAVTELQREVLSVRHKITKILENVVLRCDLKNMREMDEADKNAVIIRTREILHQGFKFGFDYHKEIVRLFETKIVNCKDKQCEFNLSLGIIQFAKMWMEFVTKKCERGRGVRPRWATQGLDFLIAACDPTNTKHLTDTEFDDLKSKMDACISHVVGIVSEPEKIRKRASPRSRKVSPATGRALTPTRSALSPRIINEDHKTSYLHQLSMKEEPVSATSAPNTPQMIRKQTSYESETPENNSLIGTMGFTLKVPKLNSFSPALRQVRVRDAVNALDLVLDKHLREKHLIGQVKTLNNCDKIHIRARSVNFRWHRGIKIGQGRFGKVYTAVNHSTGELMAMKEITIQPNETRAIKNVAEELKIFEGISHKYLVKYYGVEVHREELLIFMELCDEGTLESLVEISSGLHEGLTRRFTAQLLSAVHELHKHGVVHRDIKTANIFLTNGGNCLKLGDFGSAVKIQAHTTVPGELQGYVGTQAYMAPEVFTKTNTDGHGRAADIWSVGCVVIEMSSGKRPWSQFDSNFQIMFKVGMGETPEAPDSLSDEGKIFLEHCLEHDPKLRWTTVELLQHNFCKVDLEMGCDCAEQSAQDFRRYNSRKNSEGNKNKPKQ